MRSHYTLKDLAALFNVAPHKITYLISSRQLDEPALRIGNVRVWTTDELELVAKKLKVEIPISTAEDK